MDTQIREGFGFSPGLLATRSSSVDGEAGVLLLAGFPVEEIAPRVYVRGDGLAALARGRCPRLSDSEGIPAVVGPAGGRSSVGDARLFYEKRPGGGCRRLGHVHHPATPFTDLLEQFVAADPIAGFFRQRSCARNKVR